MLSFVEKSILFLSVFSFVHSKFKLTLAFFISLKIQNNILRRKHSLFLLVQNINKRSVALIIFIRSVNLSSRYMLLLLFLQQMQIISQPPETLKYWVGVQRGHSYLIGRRCLFSLGWPPF